VKYEAQQEMVRRLEANGLIADEAPNVSVNANTADRRITRRSQANSFAYSGRGLVLLVDSGPSRTSPAPFTSISLDGYVGETVPHRYTEIFEVVREARDAAISMVQRRRVPAALRGYEWTSRAQLVTGAVWRLLRAPHGPLDWRRGHARRQHDKLRNPR